MGQELPRLLFLHHLDAAYNLARWIESDQDAQDVVQEATLAR